MGISNDKWRQYVGKDTVKHFQQRSSGFTISTRRSTDYATFATNSEMKPTPDSEAILLQWGGSEWEILWPRMGSLRIFYEFMDLHA